MALVLAVASPKGGVGKTVMSVNLAVFAARLMRLHVMLTDTDDTRCAYDWIEPASDEHMPIDVAYGADDPESVAQLRDADYDLVVLDLAGARTGHFQRLLKGNKGKPAVDFLLVPTRAEHMDLKPVVRVVDEEIKPLEMPYLMVFSRVTHHGMDRAMARRDELRENGFNVAQRIVREYSTHNEASEVHKTVLDLPGKHSKARSAEKDLSRVGIEVFGQMGLDTEPLKELAA
jgi:cellulose biosynthesis protein BcsQ